MAGLCHHDYYRSPGARASAMSLLTGLWLKHHIYRITWLRSTNIIFQPQIQFDIRGVWQSTLGQQMLWHLLWTDAWRILRGTVFHLIFLQTFTSSLCAILEWNLSSCHLCHLLSWCTTGGGWLQSPRLRWYSVVQFLHVMPRVILHHGQKSTIKNHVFES